MSKSRNFTFTYNNYPSTLLVDELACKYIIYGKEVGESGTPHLQGFVSFPSPHTLVSVIKKLPGCHVEVARNAVAAVEYCKKEGQFTERGEAPLSPKEAADKGVSQRWALAKEGRFTELPPENIKTYEYIKRKFTEVADIDTLDHEWRFGPSGSGKSRSTREEFPGLYNKGVSKWWDGYNHEDVVLVEDWDPKTTEHLGSRYLKIWGDHYAFPAEVKGGSLMVRPKKVIITSQYSIEQCFSDPEDRAALNRRFKQVRFGEMPVYPCFVPGFNPVTNK